jgi:hypothetical protein
MSQFETFAAYLGRFITFETFLWIFFLMVIAFLLRTPFSIALRVSIRRYLLIALAFAGVIGLSLRFWIASGTLSTFWLFAPELWSAGFHLNANLVLNVILYIPPATLLVLAKKSWWKVSLVLIGMSFVAETIQQYFRIGSGDPLDWLANTVGTIFGIALGLTLLKVWPSWAADPKQ